MGPMSRPFLGGDNIPKLELNLRENSHRLREHNLVFKFYFRMDRF